MSFEDLSVESQKHITESQRLSVTMINHFTRIYGDSAPTIKGLLNAFAKGIELLQRKIKDMQMQTDKLQAFEASACKERELEAAASKKATEELRREKEKLQALRKQLQRPQDPEVSRMVRPILAFVNHVNLDGQLCHRNEWDKCFPAAIVNSYVYEVYDR
jgi:hypothetical protein